MLLMKKAGKGLVLKMDNIYLDCFGIDKKVLDFASDILDGLKERFNDIDDTAEYNQLKVLSAMQAENISEAHLHGSTGYGYDDAGRDSLEKVYAGVFNTEDALVRPQIVSGTHAINVALSGNLRPGDELLSPAGRLYDTMDEIIGIRPSSGSLKEYGISYRQAELKDDGTFDYEAVKRSINDKTRLVSIQRSKGYDSRPSFSVKEIGELIAFIKGIKSLTVVY